MRKYVCVFFCVICLAALFSACYDSERSSVKDDISRELGIDGAKGEIVMSIDTHGGFLGDGTTHIEVQFSEEDGSALEEDIIANQGWNALPLTWNIRKAVSILSSPQEEIPTMPKIEAGYYCFSDRHSESKNAKDDSELCSRLSWNFTLAVYDLDARLLYYYRFDT